MITTDEEIGGFDGAQMLAKNGYIPKVLVLPDGGANWNIEQSCKGIWFITLTAAGKSAHGSRPWEGENAITKLMDGLREIQALFPKESSKLTNTINIGVIEGGKTINTIPGTASASIDFRFTDQPEMDKLQGNIIAIAKQYDLQLTVEVAAKPVFSDPADPYMALYAEITQDIIGRKPDWIISNAGNDGRFFVEKGALCIVGYPEGGNHHGANEWIGKEGLHNLQKLFTRYIEATTGPNKIV
jgi:acetylornithine deacetylase/succinyl-diaminopimelate desuccinylase-like protein